MGNTGLHQNSIGAHGYTAIDLLERQNWNNLSEELVTINGRSLFKIPEAEEKPQALEIPFDAGKYDAIFCNVQFASCLEEVAQ